MSDTPRKKRLLTLSDLETVEVEKSRITTATPAFVPEKGESREGTSDATSSSEAQSAADEAAARAAAEQARAREEELARRLAETEAARAEEQARARRTQHLLLGLGGALAAALLVGLLFLIFQPNPLDPTEYRARNVVPPELPQPELHVGFIPRPEAQQAPAEEAEPRQAPPRRSRPARSTPGVDTGSLF